MEQFCRILLAFPETCVLFCFVFEIFQNQSAAGNVIQLNKKISLIYHLGNQNLQIPTNLAGFSVEVFRLVTWLADWSIRLADWLIRIADWYSHRLV